jgi:hypothetical protein
MNTSLLIELKKEYNILLCHILTPLILEGLQHLYTEAKKNSDKTTVLKTFQKLLKVIPLWSPEIVSKELTRIQAKTSSYPWFFKLIQSVFKINMLIMNLDIPDTLKEDVNLGQFIHHIYIECAREFWMDPFLFYHDYSSLDQKKNYLEIIRKINLSIENSIRMLLPMGVILDKFLGEKAVNSKQLDITELYNIQLLLDISNEYIDVKSNKSLEQNNNIQVGGNIIENNDNNIMLMNGIPINVIPVNTNNVIPINANNIMPMNGIPMNANNIMPMNTNNVMNTNNAIPVNNNGQNVDNKIPEQSIDNNLNDTMDKNINQKILNILNKNNINTDSNDLNQHFTVNNNSINNNNTDRKSSSTLKRIIKESIKNTQHTTKTNSANSEIKNKVLKELDSDTLTYNPEKNAEDYQDIFSNSDVKNTINTLEKQEKKNREKFFNNYLNI